MSKGMEFESETDTEVIVKLVKHISDKHKNSTMSFRELVELAIQQLVQCCILSCRGNSFQIVAN